MTITVEIPEPVASYLAEKFGDTLGAVALERLIVHGYSTGALGRRDVREYLGFDNIWQTERWLYDHGATTPLTNEDVIADVKRLEQIPRRVST